MSLGGIYNIFMTISLLLHSLGNETLPTMERREKRHSSAVGNLEKKKKKDFSSPFAIKYGMTSYM